MAERYRTDLAGESRLLKRRAGWCAVVFALGILITTLNFMPPVKVFYRVHTQVVVEASKVPRLQQLAASAYTSETKHGATAAVREVKVLDRTLTAEKLSSKLGVPTNDNPAKYGAETRTLVLVAIDSVWTKRCDEAVHTEWVQALTRSPIRDLHDTETARAYRFARWELSAAEHYAEQHAFQSSNQPAVASADRRTYELGRAPEKAKDRTGDSPAEASASSAVPSQLASHTRELDAAGAPGSGDFGQQLDQAVEDARHRLALAGSDWEQTLQESVGSVHVAATPRIRAGASSIPLWMAASVLILGVASGSIAGWLQYRLHSGGAYEPLDVANQLAREGLPVAGVVTMADDLIAHSDWVELASRKASYASRRVARQLTRISEVTLGFWCLLIGLRLVLDPMWRGILIDSPLAAFGRLMAGMP